MIDRSISSQSIETRLNCDFFFGSFIYIFFRWTNRPSVRVLCVARAFVSDFLTRPNRNNTRQWTRSHWSDQSLAKFPTSASSASPPLGVSLARLPDTGTTGLFSRLFFVLFFVLCLFWFVVYSLVCSFVEFCFRHDRFVSVVSMFRCVERGRNQTATFEAQSLRRSSVYTAAPAPGTYDR
jgi:hypothetical protein